MENYTKDMRCEDFMSALASSAPAPGGGAAAAYCGALAAALCAMVGNITKDKKSETAALAEKAEKLAAELLVLIDKDAEGFLPLSKIYSMPKDTEGYAEMKREATFEAIKAPLEMINKTAEAVTLLEKMMGLSSKLLLSDLGCAAVIAESALKSAAMNVFVNTRLLKDDRRAEEIAAEVDRTLETYIPLAEQIERDVMDYLRPMK